MGGLGGPKSGVPLVPVQTVPAAKTTSFNTPRHSARRICSRLPPIPFPPPSPFLIVTPSPPLPFKSPRLCEPFLHLRGPVPRPWHAVQSRKSVVFPRRGEKGKHAKLHDAAAHRQVRAEELALAVAGKQKTRDMTMMWRKAVRPEPAQRVPRRSPSTKHAEVELHESTVVPKNVVRHA